MKILTYIPEHTDAGERFQKALEAMPPKAELIIVHTLKILEKQLCIPQISKPAIIILLAENTMMLRSLFDMKSLFQDIDIILILPDEAEETLCLGHQLYPRYISFKNSDFSDVLMVMKKMVQTKAINHGKVKLPLGQGPAA